MNGKNTAGRAAEETRKAALELARVLEDGKGGDVLILDVSGVNAFADFFVIATVSSSAHMRGLHRAVTEAAAALNLHTVPVKQSNSASEEWLLVDFGGILVHLMTAPARAFYDLENLWFSAEKIRPASAGENC